MTPTEYIEQAILTECPYGEAFFDRLTPVDLEILEMEKSLNLPTSVDIVRLLHAGMGMNTEAGEFLDVLKKYMMYGKPVDRTNLAEEVGDMLWYIAIACNVLGVSLENLMANNIQKLRTRYPNKFTSYDAIHRNVDAERAVLDQMNVG
jgi:NTP pyrophosphatase (non-canonical NTP hydrolase)